MAFLDFIKNRSQQQQQPTDAPRPQAREQTQAMKRVEDLPAHVKAQAVEAARPAAQLMDRATQHRHHGMDGQAGHGDTREALMHNQSAHGKTQEAMSPTDSHRGHALSQARGRGMER